MAGTEDNAPKSARGKKAAAPDPETLAADIEKTREELAETLDAIADKVSPKRAAKRTTKKVTAAVKETAHDAASAVKETATGAKEKVTRSDQSWAKPEPVAARPLDSTTVAGVSASVEEQTTQPVELPPAAPVEVPDLTTAPPASYPTLPTSTARPTAGSVVKPEYVVAGAFAALIAWLLLRRR